jgi:hypothetical protein
MRTSYIWNQKGLPHKGWTCNGVEELEHANFTCEMCGKENIRFVHNLEHPEGYRVSVGCECAGHLTEQYEQMRELNKQAQRQSANQKNLRALCNKFVKTPWSENKIRGAKEVGRLYASYGPAYRPTWKYSFNIWHKDKKILKGLTMSIELAKKTMDNFIGEYHGKD